MPNHQILGISAFGVRLGTFRETWLKPAGPWLILGVVLVLVFALWVRHARLRPGDWQWLRHLGGYLGFKGRLPAGKFNAGQKLYFWFSLLCGLGLAATGILMSFRDALPSWMPLVYTLHDGLAVLLVCGVLAHLYLAIIACPGSLRAIFEGKVNRCWAEEHHPDWQAAPTAKSGEPG